MPLSKDLSKYGRIIESNDPIFKVLSIDSSKKLIELSNGMLLLVDNEYILDNLFNRSMIIYKNNLEYCRISDKTCNDSKYDFIRIIGNVNIKIKNSVEVLIEQKLSTKFLNKLRRDKKKKLKIITYDIETFLLDNVHVPYACGWYNGKIIKKYYLSDFKDVNHMLKKSLIDLLFYNSEGNIYIHNLSNFDFVFLNKILFKDFFKEIIYKEGKLILIKICTNYNVLDKNGKLKVISHTLNMYDSYQILRLSLKNACIKYDVEVKKSYFPYTYVNENNLNYIGDLPNYEYFKNFISLSEYKEYCNKFKNKYGRYIWNLKEELFRYLDNDLISLFQVLDKFSNIIFNLESVDISKCPTISSIALRVYRTNYIGKNNIPIIKGVSHAKMRKAYYGGIVEVFKLYGVNLKLWDVNSLYPSSMLNVMPVGIPVWIKSSVLEDYFGIVYASIKTPENVLGINMYPLLPLKIDNRLYNPQGTWSGWYFSEELKYAKLMGYTIDVYYGYNFEKGLDLFTNYVYTYFNFKKESNSIIDKNTSKLLLNSLYGRLGLIDKVDIMGIFNSEESENILKQFSVKEQFNITEDLEFLRYEKIPYNNYLDNNSMEAYLNLLTECDYKNFNLNHSLPIAIATTAYARIYMFKIISRLVELGIGIYYMDTDSLVIDGDMPDDLIGDNLGQFKLEYSIEEGIFVDPKLYALKLGEDKYIFKNKGLMNPLTFEQYHSLLEGESLTVTENRQFKNIKNSLIRVSSMDINLKANHFKRNPIKIGDDPTQFYTIPYVVNNGVLVK